MTGDEESRIGRFFDSWDGWSMLLIASAAVAIFLVLIPFFNTWIQDAGVRFSLLVLGLMVVALGCIGLSLPPRKEYYEEEVISSEPTFHKAEESLEDTESQLHLYKELQSVFVNRIKTRRSLDETKWFQVRRDIRSLMTLLGDEDLAMLAMAELNSKFEPRYYSSNGLALGAGFRARYDVLLRKVEGWR